MNPLRVQALALGASLMHVLVDFQVGLFGRGDVIPVLQAANITSYTAIYALWGWALGAAGGSRGPVAALVVLAGVWGALGQGVAGFAACPPPCGGATGLQDAAHLLSAVFGTRAAWLTIRAFTESAGHVSWWPSVFAFALIAAAFALQGMTFAATR